MNMAVGRGDKRITWWQITAPAFALFDLPFSPMHSSTDGLSIDIALWHVGAWVWWGSYDYYTDLNSTGDYRVWLGKSKFGLNLNLLEIAVILTESRFCQKVKMLEDKITCKHKKSFVVCSE